MTAKAENASNAQTDAKEVTLETTAQVGESQGETKKVNRRGVAGARGVQRLKFTHEIAKTNGLFIGHLSNVELSDILIGEDKTGMPSFNGLEIPKLVLTFASNEEDPTKRHYQTLQFTAVESTVDTIPGGKGEWKVNLILDYFKHILDTYVFKGKAMTDAEEEALSLSFEDFDEQGEYSPIDPETVIAGYKVLFENVENLLNRGNDGKPTYKTKDGKIIGIWMKLIRYVKNKKKGWQAVNGGNLSFPSFVGEGVIEIFKQNVPPSIRIDAVNETIRPMNIETAKAPNGPGAGIPAMGGISMGNMGGFTGGNMNDFNNISSDAGDDDIPF